MSGALVHNAYPELPELPFTRTTLPLEEAVTDIKEIAQETAIKRATYVIFYNESAGGRSGVNNNYIGLQADGSRLDPMWSPLFSGTCVHAENMTGKARRFICFKDPAGSLDFLAAMVARRGLYVGGDAHPYSMVHIATEDDWPDAYHKEWVTGDRNAILPVASRTNLLKLYEQAKISLP